MESFFSFSFFWVGAVNCPSVSTASFSAGHSQPADSAPTVIRSSPGFGMAAPFRSSTAEMLRSSKSRSRFFARTSPPQSTSTALPVFR